jgi:hypothetical protein
LLDRVGEFWSYPQSRAFAELLIDCKKDRTLRHSAAPRPQLHQHDPDLLPGAAMATRAGQAPVSNIWWGCQRSGGTV